MIDNQNSITPIKILRLIARLNIGGPAIQAITLSSSRLGDQYETLLVCGDINPGEGDMSYLAIEQGVRPYVIKAIQRKISLFGDLKSLWEIRKIIKRFQPQIIHTHTAKAGTLGRVAALTIGIPFLSARKFRLVHTFHGHTFHSYFSYLKTLAFIQIERILAGFSDKIIVISKKQKDDICDRYKIADKKKVRIISLGFDLSKFGDINIRRNNSKEKNLFKVLKSEDGKGINGHKSLQTITELLEDIVSAEQINGIDIVEISAESPTPYEAALIANTCADQYKQINLEGNRNPITIIRMFLEKQSKEKLSELNNAEDALKSFQERGGIVALDAQSIALINQLAQLDALRDAAKVDLMTSNAVLIQYKNEVMKQDPQLVEYLESQTSQAYIDVLQKQIAELQMNRDFAMANKNPNIDVSSKVKDYDKKITKLIRNKKIKINRKIFIRCKYLEVIRISHRTNQEICMGALNTFLSAPVT